MGNSLFEKLYQNGIIVITSNLGPEATGDLIQAIMNLNAMDPFKEIHLYISSGSPNFINVLALYDTITSIANPLYGYAIGGVSDCSVLLLAACDKGKRFILKNTEIGLDEIYGFLDSGVNQQTEMELLNKETTKQKEIFEELLAKHTGRTVEEIHNACVNCQNFSAEEAIEYGLVDHILG